MRPRESWASDFPKACSRVAGQPSPESDNRPAASFAGPRSVNLKQGCLGGQIVNSPTVFHSESREIRIHGTGSVERRDRLRPREHPREVVWGHRKQGPFLHHAPRVLHDGVAASVRVPEGQRSGRLEGDGEGLRVCEGAVRDPDGQGLRRGPSRGEQGLGGPGLRGVGGYQSDLAGAELLPRPGRDQPETVRAVPASPHENREGRDRTGGPVEERTTRLDQPPERRARPHDADVPGRTEGPAGATGYPAGRDLGGRDRLGAPAHQDADDGVRLVAIPRPLPGRTHAAHSGEGRRQGASPRHHGRGKADARSDGRIEGEPRRREGQLRATYRRRIENARRLGWPYGYFSNRISVERSRNLRSAVSKTCALALAMPATWTSIVPIIRPPRDRRPDSRPASRASASLNGRMSWADTKSWILVAS